MPNLFSILGFWNQVRNRLRSYAMQKRQTICHCTAVGVLKSSGLHDTSVAIAVSPLHGSLPTTRVTLGNALRDLGSWAPVISRGPLGTAAAPRSTRTAPLTLLPHRLPPPLGPHTRWRWPHSPFPWDGQPAEGTAQAAAVRS